MESKESMTRKTLNKGGQAELDLLRDEITKIFERLKVAEQITKAILSKITRMQKNG